MQYKESRQKATNNYRAKSLANISLIISHTEPEVFDALQKIQAHYDDCSKAMAIKTALVEYAKLITAKN